MATLNKYKNFTGLVGTVILSSWRGIEYIRHKGRKPVKAPSVKQLAHRQKTGLISKFIYSMHPLLDRTFNNFANRMTGANAAYSYNIKNAVKGTYPGFSIDYSRILVSRGDLPNALNPAAETTGNGKVQFTWTDNSGTGQAAPSDKFIAVLHFPELNKITRYFEGTADRKEETASVDLSKLMGRIAECWVVFISENEKEVADSVYTGRLVIM